MTEIASHQVALLAVAVGIVIGLLRIVVRREPDPFIAKVIVVGLLAKLFGTAAFYTVLQQVYDGAGDANRYFRVGRSLASEIRGGQLPDEAFETGTPFMEFLTGVVVAVIGPTRAGAYVVFSLLAFVGMMLFLQAFRLAFPQGNHRRYALLVLLLPTMVFWSSMIGKEAWLVLTLGLASYGAARALRKRRFSYLFLVAGVAGIFAIRPHMAALFVVALAVGFVVRFRDPDVRIGLVSGILGVIVVGFGVSYVLVNYTDEVASSSRQEEGGSTTDQLRSATGDLLDRTQFQTTRGGSEFDSRPVRNPIDFAHALVTVPFRPFPNEAHNRQAQLASLEGVLLLGLVIASIPRIARFGWEFFRRPYVMFATTYAIGFIIAFSNVANFGILTRQRAQLLPFLVVLLCLPIARASSDDGSGEELAGEPTGQPRSGPLLVVTAERTQAAAEGGQGTEFVIDLPAGSTRPPGEAG